MNNNRQLPDKTTPEIVVILENNFSGPDNSVLSQNQFGRLYLQVDTWT